MIFSYLADVLKNFRRSKNERILAEVLSDSRAVFNSFGTDIYMSDFVNNCIDRIAVEISKIEVASIIERDGTIARLNDDITRLFRFQPNPLQTTKDFLSCCEWLRRKHMNCFIYPAYETVKSTQGANFRRYTAFYPLAPVSVELGHFDDGRWAIKFWWRDGTWDVLPYDKVVHLKWRRGTSTLIGGGNDFGHVDERSTLRSLSTLDKLMQGLPKIIESSLGINGIIKAKTLIDQRGLQSVTEDFESRIRTSETGIVAIDLAGDFIPINRAMPQIPDSVMKFVKDVIRERYGISDAIMSGDYTGDQHSAFYQNCIEDFIVEFEQAMSQRLFTQR